MASKTILLLLKTQLGLCLVDGKTSVRESGLSVSTNKLPGETIHFFHTDTVLGRQCLNMEGKGLRCSDYLIFYAKDMKREIVCFLELKGAKLKDAVDQVINTNGYLRALLQKGLDKDPRQDVVWSVCICLHGSGPTVGIEKRQIDRLAKVFGQHVDIKHGRTHYDIGEFLRKLVQ